MKKNFTLTTKKKIFLARAASIRALLPVVLLAAAMGGACAVMAQPTITSLSAETGNPGTTIGISGTNFSTTPGNNKVYFGAEAATVTAATTSSLTVTVPTGATFGAVSVDNLSLNLTAFSDSAFLPTYNNSAYIPGALNLDASVKFGTGSNPYSVAIADIDGDGKPDMVTANKGDNTISVFFNTSVTGSITAGSFAGAVTFAAGNGPDCVTIGDIDGDGKPDIVVSNYNGANISVFFNTSTVGTINGSSLAPQVNFATGNVPYSVAIGDIDGDGKPEIVVSNYGDNTISVLQNTGNTGSITSSTFATQVTFGTGGGPVGVAIGDLDGDGKPDVVTTNNNASNISVFRNISTAGTINGGSLASESVYGVGSSPISIAIGDIDGDGKPDLVVANYNSANLSVLQNTTTSGMFTAGSFAAPVNFATGADPYSVAIGDLDGDGKPDLAVANSGDATVSLYRNTSTSGSITTGAFAAQAVFQIGGAPYGKLAVGDINGDGKPEVIMANYFDNAVSVLRNDPFLPPPTITSLSAEVGNPGTSVGISGTNFSATPGNNKVYFGAEAATVTAATTFSLTVTVPSRATFGPISVNNLSLNLTAFSDSAFLPTYNNSAYISGILNYDPAVSLSAGSMPYSAAIADIDGDGKPDVVVANQGDNTISVYFNTSTSGSLTAGSFAAPVTFATGSGSGNLVIGDIDGDGKPDVVVPNYNDNTISVLRNTSTPGSITSSSFAAQVTFATGGGPYTVAIGDIDGDGKPDLAVTSINSNTVWVYRNTSSAGSITSSSFEPGVTFATGSGPYYVTIGDIDGDGKPDMAIANIYGSNISVLQNTSSIGNISSSSFAGQVTFGSGNFPCNIAIGDIDGDGKPDLAVTNEHDNTISVYRNTSSAGSITGSSLAPQVIFNAGSYPVGIAIGDIDGDGKADLVAGNRYGNTVSVYHNTSSAGSITSSSLATQVTFATGNNPYYVAIGDIDGDGRPDLVVPNQGDNTVSVLWNAPLTAITGSGTVCTGSTIALSETATNGSWSSSTNATIGTNGVATGVSAGTATVTYSVAGGYTTATITVNLTPTVGSAGGGIAICTGSMATLSGTGATSYSWSGGISDGVAFTPGAGNNTYTVTGTTNGCSNTATTTVTVNIPTAGTLTGASSVFTGSNTTLTDVIPGGSWSASNGNATVAGGVVTGVTAGTVIISYTVINSCGTYYATSVITINNSIIPAPNTVCLGNSTTLTNATPGGIWSMGSLVATINGSTGVMTASAGYAGTATVTYTVGGVQTTQVVTVYPNPTPIQVTPLECAGTTTTLSDATAGGAWSGTGAGTVSGVGTLGTFTGTAAGTAMISYALPTGCYATISRTVYANPLPITGVANTCIGGVASLSDASTGANWFSSDTAVAMVSGGIVTGVHAGTAVITFESSTAGYCMAMQTVTVTTQPSGITGNTAALCPGTTLVLADGAGTWTSSNTAIATIGSTGIVSGMAGGTSVISYFVAGAEGCSANTTVTVNTVAAITGTTTICTGGTTTLADASGSGTWLSGSTGIATVNAAGLVTGVATGTAMITYTTAGGCVKTVIVTVSGASAAINGNLFVCNGATTTLSDASTGGTWSMGSTIATVAGSTGVVTASTTYTGTATISYTSSGCSVTAVLTVNAKPTSILGAGSECAGFTTSLSDATAGGTWNVSGDATITGAGASASLVAGAVGGTAIVSYTFGTGCMTTSINTIYAKPLPITGNFNLCVGLVTILSDASPVSSWSSSSTAIAVASGADITGEGAGVATITFKSSAAGTCITTQTVTVSAMPVVTAINGPATISELSSPVSISDLTVGGIWTSSNTSVLTLSGSTGSPVGVTAWTTTGSAVITYAVTVSGCTTKVTKTFGAAAATHTTGTTTVYAGSIVNLADDVASGIWSSSDNGVATVDVSGLVTGIMPGSVTITHEITGDDGIASRNVTNVTVSAIPVVINVLPNPNKGTFTVRGTVGSVADEAVTLEVTDMLGQVIYRNKVTAIAGKLNETITLSNALANGMYILNVQSGTETKAFHFVIEQ